MTNEQRKAYEWAKNQKYTSVAAQYARTLAEAIDGISTQSEDNEKGCEYCNGGALENLILTHIFEKPKIALRGGGTPVQENERPSICPNCGKRLKRLDPQEAKRRNSNERHSEG